jgi:DNA-binding NtrC family response regulator
MNKNRFDLLIVGPQGPIEELLGHLEGQERYELHYCPDFYSAGAYLAEYTPSAIIVAARPCERTRAEAVDWLETARNVAPVLVFCPFEDLEFYKTVMDHGAFDFFTSATPLEEIDRELNNAITWQTCQPA